MPEISGLHGFQEPIQVRCSLSLGKAANPVTIQRCHERHKRYFGWWWLFIPPPFLTDASQQFRFRRRGGGGSLGGYRQPRLQRLQVLAKLPIGDSARQNDVRPFFKAMDSVGQPSRNLLKPNSTRLGFIDGIDEEPLLICRSAPCSQAFAPADTQSALQTVAAYILDSSVEGTAVACSSHPRTLRHFSRFAAARLREDNHTALKKQFIPTDAPVAKTECAANLGVGRFLVSPFDKATI